MCPMPQPRTFLPGPRVWRLIGKPAGASGRQAGGPLLSDHLGGWAVNVDSVPAHLELHPGGAQRPGCRRRSRIGRRVQQHRLASARFTTQQQCRAFGSSPIKDCADQRVLTAASDQKRRLSKSFQRGQPRREAGSPAYERTPPALAGRYLGAVLLEEPGHARIPPLRSRSTVADGDGYPANPGGGAWRQRDGRLSAAGYHDVAEPVRAA
jgi:hypothetical protein